ncbi:hypothetical protein CEK28_11610 [Xenophilus sp. AP218F]|nr:hypothetical protein CEK28_11610 [Xenophilus sp. AP218F]
MPTFPLTLASSGWAAFALYLAPAWLALRSPAQAPLWMLAASVLGAAGWWLNYRRYRLLADTPGSRLASAALGRVEISGVARCHPGAANISPLSGRRCVWYSCARYRDEVGDWNWLARRQPDYRESCGDSFLLCEAERELIVLPEGAEASLARFKRWREDGMVLEESWIDEGDRIYVSGELASLDNSRQPQDFRLDLGAKLAQWKQDPARLRQRFDRDGNGQLDAQEWEQARLAAARELAEEYRRDQNAAPTLLLRQPRDGRPFLIGQRSAAASARRYRRRAWLHAAIALAALIAWAQLAA